MIKKIVKMIKKIVKWLLCEIYIWVLYIAIEHNVLGR